MVGNELGLGDDVTVDEVCSKSRADFESIRSPSEVQKLRNHILFQVISLFYSCQSRRWPSFLLWNRPNLFLFVPHCSFLNSDVINCWNYKLGVAICSQLTYCELGPIWQKVHLYIPALYHKRGFLHQAGKILWDGSFGGRSGLPFSMYAFSFSSLLTTPTVFVDLKYAGISLLWLECLKAQQWVLMEALKPFLGLFSNGPVVSFALVIELTQSVLCVIWFLCRCWVTNLVPRHCLMEGQNWRWITETMKVECYLHSLVIERGQWRHDKSITNCQYSFQVWVSVKLSYTGLLGYLPVCTSY